MRRKNIFIFVTTLFVIFSYAGRGQDVPHFTDSLTLSDAMEEALYNNYSLQIARNNYEIAENNVTLGNAGFLPTVDATASHNSALVNGEQIGGSGSEDIVNRRPKSTVFGAELNWMIFDGRQMFLNYDRLKGLRAVADAELRFNIESLLFNLSTIFYQAAQEEARLQLLQKNLELTEERIKIARDMYELGRSSKMEFLQAQVDYNTDKSTLLSQVEVVTSRKNELLQLMAVEGQRNFHIKYEIDLLQDISIDSLLEIIENENTLLQRFRRLEEIAHLEQKLFQAQRLPTLEVFTGYNYSEVQRAVGFSFQSNTTEFAYGFTARLRIFDGFNLNRQIENAKLAAVNARLTYNEQKLALITQMRNSYVSYTNNLQLMKLEEENLDVALENLEIAQERYSIGLSNSLERREAQINYLNAEIRFQNAAFAAKLAETELLFLSGSSIITY